MLATTTVTHREREREHKYNKVGFGFYFHNVLCYKIEENREEMLLGWRLHLAAAP